MQFLKHLVQWFMNGSIENPVSTPETSSSKAAVAIAPTEEKEKKPSEDLDFDLNKGSSPTQFLDDLKSIEPISKQFSTAREDLLAELKKLAPSKRSSP